ncbi:MAG: ribonuclease Y [Candidatus Peregrinibacteria bacterium]
MDIFLIGILGTAIGAAAGYFLVGRKKSLEIEADLERKIREAEKKVVEEEKKSFDIERKNKELEREGERQSQKMMEDAKDEISKKEREIERESARLEEREKSLDEKVKSVEEQKSFFKTKTEELEEEKRKALEVLQEEQKKLSEVIKKEETALEQISGLSKDEAKEELFAKIEQTAEEDLVNKMHRCEDRMKEEMDAKARNTIVQAVQRLASEVTSENTISTLELESDDLKGRIIGKEGRNINAFERTTGVNIIIDDTPSTVFVSSFDPLRRYIAVEVLKELLADGRIHPARITEVMAKKVKDTDKLIQEEAEKAVYDVGVTGIAPELIKILGRLKFRTSYGQNVLQHSVEVAHVAGLLAEELGADVEIAKKAGLLHDLGKTLSQEIGGKHALLSGDIARKYKLDERIVHAIEAHHEDVPITSIEAYIIQAADAISASRPGARRETSEKFIKRMMELEGIATSFKGVDKCFAMSAGREMWIFVNPEDITDLEASKLSWDITRRIENDVQYPGEVKVVVIRESRYQHTAK